MKKHITSFYLETLLLITVFVAIIMVLTAVFGQARSDSMQAKRLTEAVGLAENAAEAVAAADDVDALGNLLGEIGRVQQDGDALVVHCGEYKLRVTWEPDLAWVPSGTLVTSIITVYLTDTRSDMEVYSLETAKYLGEAAE